MLYPTTHCPSSQGWRPKCPIHCVSTYSGGNELQASRAGWGVVSCRPVELGGGVVGCRLVKLDEKIWDVGGYVDLGGVAVG